MIKRTMAALASAVVLAATGCGASGADLCDLECECEGCSDYEREECIDDFDDAARDAEHEGCEDELDIYLSCLDDTGECRGDDFETDCGKEKDDFKACVD